MEILFSIKLLYFFWFLCNFLLLYLIIYLYIKVGSID